MFSYHLSLSRKCSTSRLLFERPGVKKRNSVVTIQIANEAKCELRRANVECGEMTVQQFDIRIPIRVNSSRKT